MQHNILILLSVYTYWDMKSEVLSAHGTSLAQTETEVRSQIWIEQPLGNHLTNRKAVNRTNWQ